MKIFFSFLLLLISLTSFAQQETKIVSQEELMNMNTEARRKFQELIKPKKEMGLILAKTQLDSDQIAALEKLVTNYAKAVNPYRKKPKDEDMGTLKELETNYKFKLRQLLGEQEYSKLLTVVRVN